MRISKFVDTSDELQVEIVGSEGAVFFCESIKAVFAEKLVVFVLQVGQSVGIAHNHAAFGYNKFAYLYLFDFVECAENGAAFRE